MRFSLYILSRRTALYRENGDQARDMVCLMFQAVGGFVLVVWLIIMQPLLEFVVDGTDVPFRSQMTYLYMYVVPQMLSQLIKL